MKKLLGIIILGLLLSVNAYAEEIVLECKSYHNSFDGKIDNDYYSETIVLDLNKKHWKYSYTKKGNESKLIIQDNFFATYYVQGYVVGVANPTITVTYDSIDRYNGERVSVNAGLPVDIGKKIQKMNKSKSNLKTFNEIKGVVLREYMKSQDGWFVKFKCTKSKKVF